ncbi:sortase domain-bontaining protein [Streptomyces sp. NPDC048604]|uniref:sortase domain-containing protein n=1 Tax=Streptomyces sp. NPDC048604 TaxID=3365578 RepID=UPI003712B612
MSPRNARLASGRRRRLRLARTAALGAVLAAAVWWSVTEDPADVAAPAAAVRADHKPGAPESGVRPLGRSRATVLALPGITVEARVVALSRSAAGRPPGAPELRDPEVVGWYAHGPSPGEPGTAVVVGRGGGTGTAVLHGLGALQRGNTVRVTRADGLTAVFTVDEVRAHALQHLPAGETGRGAPRVRVIAVDAGSAVDVRGRLTEVSRER